MKMLRVYLITIYAYIWHNPHIFICKFVSHHTLVFVAYMAHIFIYQHVFTNLLYNTTLQHTYVHKHTLFGECFLMWHHSQCTHTRVHTLLSYCSFCASVRRIFRQCAVSFMIVISFPVWIDTFPDEKHSVEFAGIYLYTCCSIDGGYTYIHRRIYIKHTNTEIHLRVSRKYFFAIVVVAFFLSVFVVFCR